MGDDNERRQGWIVFLLVLLLHGLLLNVLVRRGERDRFAAHESSGSLIVYFLPREVVAAGDIPKPDSKSTVRRGGSVVRKEIVRGMIPVPSSPPIQTQRPLPRIDWQHELELTAQDMGTIDQQEKTYRDLAKSLSSAQLEWLKQNHMVPASPGMTWKSPRVEVAKDGMPIVHISDHCVLVPLFIVPMVFCSFGHVAPNEDLFKHMHDSQPP